MESFDLKNRKLFEQAIGIALMSLLTLFCFLVLKPFVTAMLWAAILVFASWPVFSFMKRRLTHGSSLWAASIMTLLAALLLVIPLWIVAVSSLDMVTWLVDRIRAFREEGVPQVIAAMKEHPFLSRYADMARSSLTEFFSDTDHLARWGASVSRVSLHWLVQRGVSLGYGVFQVFSSLIFMFFFFLHGEAIADLAGKLMERVGGSFMLRLRHRMALTLRVVVRGTIGTALVQALAASIGFALFGVPNVVLFSAITFVLGVLPLGPPFLWVPIGLWLLAIGRVGDGIGMLIYGGVVISSIDNIVRPILIAGAWDFSVIRRRRQPLVLALVVGLLVGAGFWVMGLPWWVGGIAALAIGFTPFASAGVVAFLGGAIWLFATGRLLIGIWLLLAALLLMLLMPVLVSAVRRWVPEAGPTAIRRKAASREDTMPFSLLLIGVMGGLFAFGFIGMFLGPVVLALGHDLIRELTQDAMDGTGNTGKEGNGAAG
ncbi:MAG: AI-2E family transporter [Verrucomicrobiota bacterium]|jgi:predicted PurR-regulated permease PerM|nr:AI-2E family transporter [Verrucomicrobiota bacterium]